MRVLLDSSLDEEPAPLLEAAASLSRHVPDVELTLASAVPLHAAVGGIEQAEGACDELEQALVDRGVRVSATRVLRVCSTEHLLATSCAELSAAGLLLAATHPALHAILRALPCPALVVGHRWVGEEVEVCDLRGDPPLLRWEALRSLLPALSAESAALVWARPADPVPVAESPWGSWLSSLPAHALSRR